MKEPAIKDLHDRSVLMDSFQSVDKDGDGLIWTPPCLEQVRKVTDEVEGMMFEGMMFEADTDGVCMLNYQREFILCFLF